MRDPLTSGEFRLVGLAVFLVGCLVIWLAARIWR